MIHSRVSMIEREQGGRHASNECGRRTSMTGSTECPKEVAEADLGPLRYKRVSPQRLRLFNTLVSLHEGVTLLLVVLSKKISQNHIRDNYNDTTRKIKFYQFVFPSSYFVFNFRGESKTREKFYPYSFFLRNIFNFSKINLKIKIITRCIGMKISELRYR